jgi:predicted amidohydrolase YtcJ
MVDRAVRLMNKAAAVGCTGLHDCGIGVLAGIADLTLLQTAMSKSAPVRVRGMLSSAEMPTWERMGLKPGFGDDRFRLVAVKAWSDGSSQGKTAFFREPYLGGTDRGSLNYTPEALTDAIRVAHKAGWQVGVHANGDAAIDTTLAAFETVLKEMPRADHRHRIEHCSYMRPEHIAKMAEHGFTPSYLIGHVKYWGKAFRDDILGPERADLLDPCASALAGGLRITLHSDYNVTQIHPLTMVETAVTRILNQGGDVLNPKECIPVMAALKAVTLDAAWQTGMDGITGSVEVGKYADFVVLEKDPTTVEPTAIHAIKVSETWLEGAKQFSA